MLSRVVLLNMLETHSSLPLLASSQSGTKIDVRKLRREEDYSDRELQFKDKDVCAAIDRSFFVAIMPMALDTYMPSAE
jgi:hypothetical protein